MANTDLTTSSASVLRAGPYHRTTRARGWRLGTHCHPAAVMAQPTGGYPRHQASWGGSGSVVRGNAKSTDLPRRATCSDALRWLDALLRHRRPEFADMDGVRAASAASMPRLAASARPTGQLCFVWGAAHGGGVADERRYHPPITLTRYL